MKTLLNRIKGSPFARCVFALFHIVLLVPVLLFFTGAEPGEIVYVTNSGAMYHLDWCSSLSRSKIAVTLYDAAMSGYEACSICKPPFLDIDSVDFVFNTTPLYRVDTAMLRNTGAADINQMLIAEVIGHVDGDTVRVRITNPPEELSIVETIRLLGVDTPETVHPNQIVQFFGKEASDFTQRELLGRNVYLAFDWDLRDRYGRLLAYIYTGPGLCYNTKLISEGYGYAYLTYPFHFMDEFHALEQEARLKGRGLWASQ